MDAFIAVLAILLFYLVLGILSALFVAAEQTRFERRRG